MIKFKRTRYQSGSLTIEKRIKGDVWVYRWRDNSPDGRRRHNKIIVGTVRELKTKSLAQLALKRLQLASEVSVPDSQRSRTVGQQLTFGALTAHYKAQELSADGPDKSVHTKRVYGEYSDLYILPRWGEVQLDSILAVDVENWLRSLSFANATKAKIRNIMGAIFKHGNRYELTTRNPIPNVRQSAKRQKQPSILEPSEIQALLSRLGEPYRTMVLLDASTGLRISELCGLQWQDVDFEKQIIQPKRSIVRGIVGRLKTEASGKSVPIAPEIIAALEAHRETSLFPLGHHWIFASVTSGGKLPLWPNTVLADYIQPAAIEAGIAKRIGWHTFRRSYASQLVSNGAGAKTAQDALRHANFNITHDLYVQANQQHVRDAHTKAVGQIIQMPLREAV